MNIGQKAKSVLQKCIAVIAIGVLGYFLLIRSDPHWGAESNRSMLIDNPTDKDIEVYVDSNCYVVPAGTYLKINPLNTGEHTVSCEEHGLVDETFWIYDASCGVINPTGSKYVIYPIIYANKEDLRAGYVPSVIEGRTVYTYSELEPPRVTSDLFIFDYSRGSGGNLDRVLSRSREVYRFSPTRYDYVEKIFRLDDFFRYYDNKK